MSTERANRHQRRPSQSFNFVLPENISLTDPVAADSDNGAGEQIKVVPLPPANSKSGLGRTASGVSLPPLPAETSSEKEGTSRRQG
ncbi:hypothetical protein MTR67_037769 [Solanum verrucosum]|uniref:Uncharacterized protein n=1 Tax=Solanum verrucosum TaxID=315347 RepID=A0AAF0UFF3_SOLVR|nr:hypothetical protein MTR67_037769 [Solanum verrucosum]